MSLESSTEEPKVTPDPNAPVQGMPPGSLASNLPSSDPGANRTATLDPPPMEKRHYSGLELWLHRITVLMFVFLCASVGVLLVILPWRPEWTDNHLLLGNPWLRQIVANGFVRGLCTGLGLLDIWIGFWEAIHYHEEK